MEETMGRLDMSREERMEAAYGDLLTNAKEQIEAGLKALADGDARIANFCLRQALRYTQNAIDEEEARREAKKS